MSSQRLIVAHGKGETLFYQTRNVLQIKENIIFYRKAPDVVRMGDLNLKSDADDKHAQQFSIEQIITHPLFSARFSYNDIALLKLNQSVQ